MHQPTHWASIQIEDYCASHGAALPSGSAVRSELCFQDPRLPHSGVTDIGTVSLICSATVQRNPGLFTPEGIAINTQRPQVDTPNGTQVAACVTANWPGDCAYAQTSFGGWSHVAPPTQYQIQWFDCNASGQNCRQNSTASCPPGLTCTQSGDRITIDAPIPPGSENYPFIMLSDRDVNRTIRSVVTAITPVGPSYAAWSAATPLITAR
jgi:hypothetical protein